MPLVALLDGCRVEAPALAADGGWTAVAGAGALLTCPGCGQRMVGRRGGARIAHFAHYRKVSTCSWGAGESAAHLRLKWVVCQVIRQIPGWTADLEVSSESLAWRADVLAHNASRRIAFEVQLAAQSVEETLARTQRFANDSVEVVWLTQRLVAWFGTVPAIEVGPSSQDVVGGLWRYADGWLPVGTMPLDRILRSVLTGSLVWCELPDRWIHEPRFHHHIGGGWTTPRHLARWQASKSRQQREAEAEARRELEHEERRRLRLARLEEVSARVERALADANLHARSVAPSRYSAFGHCFEVRGHVVVCEPVASELWRLRQNALVIFHADASAARAAGQGRRQLRVFTLAAFEAHHSIVDLFPDPPGLIR